MITGAPPIERSRSGGVLHREVSAAGDRREGAPGDPRVADSLPQEPARAGGTGQAVLSRHARQDGRPGPQGMTAIVGPYRPITASHGTGT